MMTPAEIEAWDRQTTERLARQCGLKRSRVVKVIAKPLLRSKTGNVRFVVVDRKPRDLSKWTMGQIRLMQSRLSAELMRRRSGAAGVPR